jgi:ribosomal protein L7/L12
MNVSDTTNSKINSEVKNKIAKIIKEVEDVPTVMDTETNVSEVSTVIDTGANVSQDINGLAKQYLDEDKKITINIETQITSKVSVLKGIKDMLDMVPIRTSTRLSSSSSSSSSSARSSGGNSNSKSKSIKKSIKKYRKHYVTKRKNLKQYRKRTKYNQRKYRSKRSKRNN